MVQGARTCWFRQLEVPDRPAPSNGATQEAQASGTRSSPLPTLQALEHTIQQRSQQGSIPGAGCTLAKHSHSMLLF